MATLPRPYSLRLHLLRLHLEYHGYTNYGCACYATAHLSEHPAAGSASGGGLPGGPSGARSAGDLSGTQAATTAAAAAAAEAAGVGVGVGVGVGGAAPEQQGAADGVARCAFESATRLDSLDVHSMQLEANLARIAHESVARDRQMTQVVQLLEHIASSQDLSQVQSQDTPPRQPPQPQPAPSTTPAAVPPRPAATTHGDATDML